MTHKIRPRDVLLSTIDVVSDFLGIWLFRRFCFRLTWGFWCKHHSWTPWERVDDRGLRMRTCEGCMIRETK